jgi:nicotinate phosphoribosyltransferase
MDTPIITSLLDTDLYKFSMMNYALELFPIATSVYKFKNRGSQRFNQKFISELQEQINSLAGLKITDEEYLHMKEKFKYLTPGYFEYLKNFRYNPAKISIWLTEDNNLGLGVTGKWVERMLLEVPLMAIISELYFTTIDTDWDYNGQEERAYEKVKRLSEAGCLFVEMGTRRRRSFKTQDMVLREFVKYGKENDNSTFLGTSNVYFAMKYGIKCYGSQAHEITQAAQALNSYNHCNYYAMENWLKVFKNLEIGTALTDTVTVDAFLKDFNKKLTILYKSVRQDSGCELLFTDKMIKHYKKMEIDPREKAIVFSNGLNVDKAIKIEEYCDNKIKCSFGIGTHFSNEGFSSPALNMVIKLWSINGCPVVKLGDDGEGKENGDPKAVEFMRWLVSQSV